MTDRRQPGPGPDVRGAVANVPDHVSTPSEPDAGNETSAIQNIDGVVALLELISVELLEMVEGLLSADLVDRLIELYEAAGLHDLAQEFTDELERAIPEVDWELW